VCAKSENGEVDRPRTKEVFIMRWFILALVWPMAFIVFAQQEIFSSSIGFGALDKLQGIEIDGYLFVKGQKEANTLFEIITPQKESIVWSCSESGVALIGASSTDDDVTVYFSASVKPKNIQCLTLSKQNKASSNKDLKNVEDEGFLTYLNFNRKFHVLRIDKKNQLLGLESFSDGRKTDSSTIAIDDAELFKEIKATRNFLNKVDIKPVFIPEGEVPFEIAKNQNKIYFRHNKLWLVMDHFRKEKDLATVMVCELDFGLHTFKKSILSLTAEGNVDHNSFLYKDTLFTLSVAKEYLIIDAFDLNSMTKRKTFRQLKGLSFDFKKSYLIENNKPIDKEWESKWSNESNSKYFFRFMNGGIPVINVSAVASDYRFLIGNYEPPKANSGGGFTSVGGGTISTPGGTVQGPVVSLPSTPHGGSSGKKTYFYGYLTKSDLAPTTEKIRSHGRLFEIERRLEYLQSTVKLGSHCVINSVDKDYLVYLNRKTMNINVEEFAMK
jgi:hypothetical protein